MIVDRSVDVRSGERSGGGREWDVERRALEQDRTVGRTLPSRVAWCGRAYALGLVTNSEFAQDDDYFAH